MKLLESIEQLRTSLDYHLARHNLLVANLSHIDTPGYHPLDLQRTGASFQSKLETALASTDANHLQSSGSASNAAAPQWKVIADPGASPGYDGNGVSLDREAVKIASNHMRYDTLAQLVANDLSDLAWAANDGKSV